MVGGGHWPHSGGERLEQSGAPVPVPCTSTCGPDDAGLNTDPAQRKNRHQVGIICLQQSRDLRALLATVE